MSQFLIEQIRYMHEEIEMMEKSIAELIEEKVKYKKKNILYDYSINYLVEKIQTKSKLLLQYYNDEDNLKKEEMQFISGKAKDQKGDVWKNYYERVKYIRDYHKKTNIKKIEIRNYKSYKNEALKNNKLKECFSPLEKKGKYVDMHKLYDDFINIKKIKQFRINAFKKKQIVSEKKKKKNAEEVEFKEIDLVTYLHNFTRFYYIPRYCKYKNIEYKNYLENVLSYLMNFFSKINVLVDCQRTYTQYEKSFEVKFRDKEINNWEKYTYDLDLYCNINDKLYASEGTYNSYRKSKNYNEDLKKYMQKEYTVEQLQDIKKNIEKEDKEMAKCEYLIELYKNLLNKVFQKTIQNIQRKQAFTVDELQKRKKGENKNDHLLSLQDRTGLYDEIGPNARIGEDTIGTSEIGLDVVRSINNFNHFYNSHMAYASSDDDSSTDMSSTGRMDDDHQHGGNKRKENQDENEDEDDEDEKTIYNPLNLPLGYDNKPIPYWLYKLHGLSKEYTCEICGNYSYFGRTMFEKHFYEWRHSFGMKCLNIPNTLHFKEITKIEDALNLYEKLKKQTQKNIFKPDQEVECEDSKGNVMNMKAYDDLKRQGLL
ncbi:splicing factor 3A subunit 3 [Plasmodium gonderi]|uniref:Splicing factor 3A subunit 3 n=1 Tax=Plasmodium gonderi TaxID=77519 RepID=A0A1Y1JDJ5_PLAGO|nr:splicing factor 3A subunit 3 [Plasmodium gonderi]GAW80310.1 splicing factor 3A subunit 3 [Plasmodium gonderi]